MSIRRRLPCATLCTMLAAAVPAAARADEAPAVSPEDAAALRRVGDRLRLRGGGPEGFMLQPLVAAQVYGAGINGAGFGVSRGSFVLRIGRMFRRLVVDAAIGYQGTVSAGAAAGVTNALTLGADVQPILVASADRRSTLQLVLGVHYQLGMVFQQQGATPPATGDTFAVTGAIEPVLGVGAHHLLLPHLALGGEAGFAFNVPLHRNDTVTAGGVGISLYVGLAVTFVYRRPRVVAVEEPRPAALPAAAQPGAPRAESAVVLGPPKGRCEAQAAATRAAAVVDAFGEMADAAGLALAAARTAHDGAEQARQTALAAAADASQRYVGALAAAGAAAPRGDDPTRRSAETAHRALEDAARRASDARRDLEARTANQENLLRLLDRARVRHEVARQELLRAGAAVCPAAPTCTEKRATADTAGAIAAALAEAATEIAPALAFARDAAETSARARDAALRAAQTASQAFLASIDSAPPAGNPELRRAAEEAHARFEAESQKAEGAAGLLFVEGARSDALKQGTGRARLRHEEAQRRAADCQRTGR